jgi:hypothetical protein
MAPIAAESPRPLRGVWTNFDAQRSIGAEAAGVQNILAPSLGFWSRASLLQPGSIWEGRTEDPRVAVIPEGAYVVPFYDAG